MTSSDDEHLAPVINIFADRSRTKLTEETAGVSSPGESSTSEFATDKPENSAWANSDSTQSAAADSRLRAETAATEADAATDKDAWAPVVVLAPVPALPTMADFSASKRIESQQAVDNSEASVKTEAVQAEVQSQAQRRQARDGFSEISRVSMRALARRGMSSYEMTQFLGTREFESEDVDEEIARLEGCGLLDDAALAETLARTLRDRKKLGASAIRAELRRRKIDQEHISAVLDDDRDEEQERATEIALKRAPQLRSLDGVTAKRRLTGFLMRKGYSGSVVSAAVTAALAPGSGGSSGGPVFR